MRTILFAVLLVLVSVSAVADNYLCVGDKVVGFGVDSDWSVIEFRADEKYIVKPVPKDSRFYASDEYQVARLGQGSPVYYCENSFDNLGRLYCDTPGSYFHMNSVALRFLIHHSGSYLRTAEQNKDWDYKSDATITIGKCSKI